MAAIDGLLLIDKSPGPTSHDVVAEVRRRLGLTRVGHTGTLDPPASGLLPLVVGRATRLARYLTDSPKIYSGTLRLGVTTSTDDMAGEVLTRSSVAGLDPARIEVAAGALRGVIEQRPPRVSARKVAGQRLHRLARQGRPADGEPRRVEVYEFDLRPGGAPDVLRFHASVSPGTYIRSLARDLGAALGVGGAVERLRRERVAGLDVADAIPAASVAPLAEGGSGWIPLDELPLVPPGLLLSDPQQVRRFRTGLAVELPDSSGGPGLRAVRDSVGRLWGIGEVGEGVLRPRTVLVREELQGRLPG